MTVTTWRRAVRAFIARHIVADEPADAAPSRLDVWDHRKGGPR